MTQSVEVFCKIFMSAEKVQSLATVFGTENQFANRFNYIRKDGELTKREKYLQVTNPVYFDHVQSLARHERTNLVWTA